MNQCISINVQSVVVCGTFSVRSGSYMWRLYVWVSVKQASRMYCYSVIITLSNVLQFHKRGNYWQCTSFYMLHQLESFERVQFPLYSHIAVVKRFCFTLLGSPVFAPWQNDDSAYSFTHHMGYNSRNAETKKKASYHFLWHRQTMKPVFKLTLKIYI